MKDLYSTINSQLPRAAASALKKHLAAVGIVTWTDINRSSLYDFRDHVQNELNGGSPKVVCGNLRAVLNRVRDEFELPEDFAKILSLKGDSTRSTYLTPEELKMLENVHTKSNRERIVLVECLIGAYTGARISDIMALTEENFQDGFLVYTSKKTKITATIPISEKTKRWIAYAQEHREEAPVLMTKERIIRRLAQRAGITAKVKTRRGGVEKITEKWEVISTHTFRKTAATNLVAAGASINDAKVCLGHTNSAMTERYICITKPELSKAALSYLL